MTSCSRKFVLVFLLITSLQLHGQTTEELINATFDSGSESFSYSDDVFRNTQQPRYASGTHLNTGVLSVNLGGVDRRRINNMSGGWLTTFQLQDAGEVTIEFDYNLSQSPHYESNERSEVLLSVNGNLHGLNNNDYIARIAGNGNGGPSVSTGWQQASINLGPLNSGNHQLTLGAYNNQKSYSNESTNLLLDNVVVRATIATPPPPPPPPGEISFSVEHLSRPAGFRSVPFDMNNNGEAVGYYNDMSLKYRAIYWDAAGNYLDLASPNSWSQAHGISNNRLITGYYGPTLQTTHPVVWNEFSPVQLNVPNGHGDAESVNSNGLTVGSAGPSHQRTAAFWLGSNLTSPSGQHSGSAFDVNDNGEAVGQVMVNGFPRAAYWDNQGNLTILPGLNGGNSRSAVAISDSGAIVGTADNAANNASLSVVWQSANATPQALPSFNGIFGVARDINDSGWVVGVHSLDSYNNTGEALLWVGTAEPMELKTLIPAGSGWNLVQAVAVNNAGQILGAGSVAGQSGSHAFRLTPNQ